MSEGMENTKETMPYKHKFTETGATCTGSVGPSIERRHQHRPPYLIQELSSIDNHSEMSN